jgi:hypothetical protein
LQAKCALIAAWELGYHLAYAAVLLASHPLASLLSLLLAFFPVCVLVGLSRRLPRLFVPFLVYNVCKQTNICVK